MSRKGFQPRAVKPEYVRIGDHINVKYTVGDMSITRHGIVAKREHTGRMTYWTTKDGNELFTRDAMFRVLAGEHVATLTLIFRTEQQPTLGEW